MAELGRNAEGKRQREETAWAWMRLLDGTGKGGVGALLWIGIKLDVFNRKIKSVLSRNLWENHAQEMLKL